MQIWVPEEELAAGDTVEWEGLTERPARELAVVTSGVKGFEVPERVFRFKNCK